LDLSFSSSRLSSLVSRLVFEAEIIDNDFLSAALVVLGWFMQHLMGLAS
jgi:hypothetical protein